MMRRLGPVLAIAVVLSATSACAGKHSRPVAFTPVRVSFDDSSFGAVLCAKPHELANCFSGTGSTTLPPLGKITMTRTVVSGDQKRTAPAGCDPADTVGTLAGTNGGSAHISGTGTLCGAVATYTLLVDGGSGAFAKLHLTGTIHNDGGAESWDVASFANS
ncbi:MAG: hypothetical protein QOE76_3569 [Frankiales bacterium]|jgi:hypothetical protein|nr:hypothetical protein [Frankiales bacterium]